MMLPFANWHWDDLGKVNREDEAYLVFNFAYPSTIRIVGMVKLFVYIEVRLLSGLQMFGWRRSRGLMVPK